jgi:hypothetical protein
MKTFAKVSMLFSLGLLLAFVFLFAFLAVSPKAAFAEGELLPVKIVFGGLEETALVYDGKAKVITAEAHEDTPITGKVFDVEYDRVPRDAGVVTATAVLRNPNYYFVGEASVEFTITQKPLTVKVEDLVVAEGETPDFILTYTGLCEGDSERDFQNLPTVPSRSYSTGEYSVVASGGVSKNYSITYVSGTLTVTKPHIFSDDNKLKIDGAFTGAATISVTKGGDVSKDLLKLRYTVLNCDVKFDGKSYGEKCYYSVSKSAGITLIPLITRVRVENSDGKHIVTDLKKNDKGDITFTSTAVGTVFIYYDFLPIVIALAAIIVLIIIIGALRSRDKKRYAACVAAEQYLDGEAREARKRIKDINP